MHFLANRAGQCPGNLQPHMSLPFGVLLEKRKKPCGYGIGSLFATDAVGFWLLYNNDHFEESSSPILFDVNVNSWVLGLMTNF